MKSTDSGHSPHTRGDLAPHRIAGAGSRPRGAQGQHRPIKRGIKMLTHINAKAVIYTNEAGVRIIARPCTDCKNPMVPALKSADSALCIGCYK